jgi:hypothetical protein
VVTNNLIVCTLPTQDDLENGDSIEEWFLGANPSTNGEDYSANANNTIVTGPDLASTGLVGGLASFFTEACDPGDDTVPTSPTCTFQDATGVDFDITLDFDNPIIGAITLDDEWTANWTYGLYPGLQSQALWFGNP